MAARVGFVQSVMPSAEKSVAPMWLFSTAACVLLHKLVPMCELISGSAMPSVIDPVTCNGLPVTRSEANKPICTTLPQPCDYSV